VLAGQLWKEETKGKRRRTLRVKGFEAVMMVVAAKAFEARTQRVIREATHASMPRERERERALEKCGCGFWGSRECHGGLLVAAEYALGNESSAAEKSWCLRWVGFRRGCRGSQPWILESSQSSPGFGVLGRVRISGALFFRRTSSSFFLFYE
jgi:hypothetical protein